MKQAVRSSQTGRNICSGRIRYAAGKLLQMIAVPLLILAPAFPQVAVISLLSQFFLWASLVMTVYSGCEYVIKNKQVFSTK